MVCGAGRGGARALLALLALPALLAPPAPLAAAAAHFYADNCTSVSRCEEGASGVRTRGLPRVLRVVWRGEAELAAAALLLRLLAAPPYRACRLALCHARAPLCALLEEPDVARDSAALLVGTKAAGERCVGHGRRLGPVRCALPGTAPRLHVRLAPSAPRAACAGLAAAPALLRAPPAACLFPSDRLIYVPRTLGDDAAAPPLPPGYALHEITRADLQLLVSDSPSSFLFVDAELWADAPNVAVVRAAFRDDAGEAAEPRPLASDDEPQLFAEDLELEARAPTLLRALIHYSPPPSLLRRLLALMDDGAPGEAEGRARGAAALRAAENLKLDNETCGLKKPFIQRYNAFAFLCEGDDEMYGTVTLDIAEDMANDTRADRVILNVVPVTVDCLDRGALLAKVEELARTAGSHGIFGGVARGASFEEAARFAETQLQWPLVAYDVQRESAPGRAGVRAATHARATGRALAQALAACGWRRVALLSEDSPAAEEVATELRRAAGPLREVRLERGAEGDTLRALAAERARVFVVNADGAAAARVLAAAAAQGLRGAWVLREWAGTGAPPLPTLPLLALRSAPRSPTVEATPTAGGRVLARWWPAGDWPPLAAPLADALMTLTFGFMRLMRRYPETRFDHQANGTVEQFRRVIQWNATWPLLGVAGPLQYSPSGDVRPPPARLEVWRAGRAGPELQPPGPACACGELRAVSDGAEECALPAGGGFAPACLTPWVAAGVPVLALAALLATGGAARWRARARRRARSRRRRFRAEAAAALLTRQPDAVRALDAWLVDPEEVACVRELGAGRFGRVHLARLGALLVAAKRPLEGSAPAEEGALLLEAAALARLEHEHVVRLVAVCVAAGVPLLITELAFFGDLLRYLRERRPLAAAAAAAPAGAGAPGEAAHVSAEALTRLAREAALALAYLARRGLVHCDVRAANCLVDERRSLKLADFGMARWADGGARAEAGGDAEGAYYKCSRRALFPVLWMAPEALARGAFSSASDVWALGVLALELVTLGARPFGALEAARAVELVKTGGHPPVPAGAARDTRRLVRRCWRRRRSARPAAARLAAWLAERPRALRPAPAALAPPEDGDSGFGEPTPTPTYDLHDRDDSEDDDDDDDDDEDDDDDDDDDAAARSGCGPRSVRSEAPT